MLLEILKKLAVVSSVVQIQVHKNFKRNALSPLLGKERKCEMPHIKMEYLAYILWGQFTYRPKLIEGLKLHLSTLYLYLTYRPLPGALKKYPRSQNW